MNALKSALRLSRNEPAQKSLQTLYGEVKSWDDARARILENHLKVVQLALDALDLKVTEVDRYIDGLDKLMTARIEQITSYCKNGVNDSEFFLVPTSLNALKPCHQLLKHLLMQQSQRQQQLANKGSALTVILQKLKKLKSEDSQSNHSRKSVTEIKSSIRYLIDCQLPDVIHEVLASCKAVSSAYTQQKDFYLAVDNFVKMAEKQLEKHRQIGKELIVLVQNFTKREKQLRSQLRSILIEWVKEDLQDKIFQEQLTKNPTQELINDYYDIENLIPQHSELWPDQSLTIFLQNLQILPFRQHQMLVIYSRQVFYNAKVEAKIVVTTQKEAYLFRLSSNQPDFTFVLGKNIKVRQKQPLVVLVSKFHKTLLMREETDFEFTLQFNLEGDLKEFEEKCRELGCVIEGKKSS